MSAEIEFRKLPDGRLQARRLDGRPLTDEDREHARQKTSQETDQSKILITTVLIDSPISPNHPTPRVTLVVTLPARLPDAPISLNGWATVVNVKGFVERTLADLEAYVAARNAGRWHWMQDLVDETVEYLRLCGVEAEISESNE